MSPISTVIPPTSIAFRRELWFPRRVPAAFVGELIDTPNTRGKPSNPRGTYNDSYNYANTGGGPVADEVKGRYCALMTTNGAVAARGWRDGAWMPAFDPTAFNPGATLDELAVVMALDFNVACTSAVFVAGTGDQTGWWFVPGETGPPSMYDGTPGSGSGLERGGFGLALNNDGGSNRWEYVSFDGTPTVLQRTPVSVPDVTDWNTFRFLIISAASGRPATLTLSANGTPVAGVDGIEFDDVALMRPGSLPNVPGQAGIGWAYGIALADMLGDGLAFDWYTRQGRFTPDGVQIQDA